MKLGELLVSSGKISSAQLEETLKGQVIFGGKLGTNLVEMGYIEEEDLARFLSEKTGIASAPIDQLMNISPELKKLLPEEMVRKHRVVPVALQNRKLHLAMSDPFDFATIDEISFLTGYIVTPLITPELRLVSALEKHYNVKREVRYISVSGGGRRGMHKAAAAPEPAPGHAPHARLPQVIVEEDEEILELPEICEYFGDHNTPALTPFHPVPAPPPVPVPAAKGYTLEEVLAGLSEARDRDEIADLLVNHAAQLFEVSAIFMVRGDKTSGWLAQRRERPVQGFETLAISLDEPSVLKTVADLKTFHLGPLPISPANSRISAALSVPDRAHTLLIPLVLMGRVVAILYLQGDAMQLGKSLPQMQRLLAKSALAFEILILKGKILAN